MNNMFTIKTKGSFSTLLKFFVLGVLIVSFLGTSPVFSQDKGFLVTDNVTANEYKLTLPKITFVDKGNEGIFIKYNFKGVVVSPIYVKGERYYMPHIYGFTHIEDIGSPRLPVRNLQFAVPYGAKAVIKIVDAKYREFTKKQVKIHPALAPHPDCYNCPEPKFEIAPAVYEKDAMFPKKPVQIVSLDTFRGVPIAVAQVRPIQYNPVTGKFRVFSLLKFKVVFEGGERSFNRFAKFSDHSNRMVKRAVLNSNSIPRGVAWGQLETRAVGKDYIIITHSNYLTQANALANWKRQLGYSVEVVSQSSWTASQIDTALKDRYNSWSPKPLYFLIIGDENTAPPEWGGSRYTDLYFAEMDGSGFKPEMAYGRLVVSSATEATTVVNKIINYEKTPPTQSSFYTNATTAAMYQDTDDYNDYADRRFCHTSEDMRNYLMGQGYTVNRIYATGSSSVDPYYYNNGYYSPSGMQIPTELKRPNFDWLDDATDINNSINAGKFILTHRDHGNVTLWGDPYYTTTHIGQLSNGNLLPVVFSINCLTGKYVDSTECFAEKFLTLSNAGCVGIFAATELSYSGYNDGYACGAIDAIWPSPGIDPQFGSGGAGNPIPSHSAIYTMGDVLNQAKLAMTYLWTDHQTTWELHHYYGDPAMQMWTAAPTTTTASHPSSVTTSSTTLSITSSNCASGIATLVYEDTLVGKTTLDGTGTGTITFAALSGSESTAILTVSKHNYKPYVANITVESGPPEPPVANFSGTPTSLGEGGSVSFTDLTSNSPTSWSWTFTGGTPSSSTSQNPTVTYNNAGVYTVSLTAANSAGNDTETKTNYITVTEVLPTVGITEVYSSTSVSTYRRAMPFTMPENGTIQSITMYHEAGSGGLMYGVYDGSSAPTNRLGVTAAVTCNGAAGWQTISLTSPVFVASGTQIWLAWVYESNPGIAYQTGSPGRYQSDYQWSGGMPDPYGSGSQADFRYSIFASYTTTPPPQYTLTTNTVGQGSIILNPAGGTYDAGTVVTVTADPDSGQQFDGWSGDLGGSTNPTTITMTSNKSITATFSTAPTTGEVGNTTVFGTTSTNGSRRAMPFTMPENGTITSVSMYHTGGSGSMILAVYEGTSSAPTNRLAVTASTAVSGTTGWQTIDLTSSAYVSSGSTVWLAWVYESNPGIRYQTGSPGRYQSSDTWSGGMPDPFGTGSQANYLYSIYATYNK